MPASWIWPALSVTAPRLESSADAKVPPSDSVAPATVMVPVLVKLPVAICSVAPLLTPIVPWLVNAPLPVIVSVSPAELAVMVPALTRAAGRLPAPAGLGPPTTIWPCPETPRSQSPAPSVSVAAELAPAPAATANVAAPVPNSVTRKAPGPPIVAVVPSDGMPPLQSAALLQSAETPVQLSVVMHGPARPATLRRPLFAASQAWWGWLVWAGLGSSHGLARMR